MYGSPMLGTWRTFSTEEGVIPHTRRETRCGKLTDSVGEVLAFVIVCIWQHIFVNSDGTRSEGEVLNKV